MTQQPQPCIESSVHAGVLILRPSGKLIQGTIPAYTIEHIDEIGARPVIWDLRDCELGVYTYAASKRNFGLLQAVADRRRGARTALVCAGGVQFGISRMLEVLGKIAGYPVEIRAFRSLESAMTWVRGCEGTLEP